MRPLDPLASLSPLAELLRKAPPAEVEAELARLATLGLEGPEAAALRFGRGALALRVGQLVAAREEFLAASEAFADAEAAALAACEGWIAAIRRGPRAIYDEAAEALAALAASKSRVVRVVATHYRGTALRFAGQAEGTLQVLLEAFAQSDGLLTERAQVLNSLGTLYVVLGAYGAADAVLAHAAELNHQIGDRVSEAISYGQLGSAALGRGELEDARRYLQQQEWFASRVGDAFGRARALVMLADVALDLGRPDQAVELASEARRIAGSVDPPLSIWLAYAGRSIGRAKLELGHDDAKSVLEEAKRFFAEIDNQLGDALVAWDLARLDGKDRAAWRAPAWAFASLGLTARVGQVIADVRRSASEAERLRLDTGLAAIGQIFPHLGDAQDVALVLSEPDTVAAIATRRIAGQRNLGRLGSHLLGGGGLYLAAVAASAIGTGIRPLPSRRSEATLLGQLPGAALLAWAADVGPAIVARDLSSLRVSLGDDARAVVGLFPDARVVGLPFAGEVGIELQGADLGPHLAQALRASPGALTVLAGTPWTGEAEALARMSGFNL
jgi:tetratricopeptide (TPR) repeat protein